MEGGTVRPISLVVALVWISPVCLAQSPASEQEAALIHSAKLSPEVACHTRYLTTYSVAEADRADYRKLADYWPNGLSTEPDRVKPTRVSDTLYAIDLRDYGWSPETWEKLLDAEPWFHEKLIVPPGEFSARGVYKAEHNGWYQQRFKDKTIVSVPARRVKEPVAHELSVRCRTAIPIVRADWFIYQSGAEGGGRKAGYYQWLGLKKIGDLEELAGFDKKKAQKRKRELAAIVQDSGVSLKSRQIFRFDAVGGSWWETRDSLATDGQSNAIRFLDGDFKFDAKEIYASLPNRLFFFALLNAKNELQAEAPTKIATDRQTTNGDYTVTVGASCIRCHAEGLRPINNWAKDNWQAQNELGVGSPDDAVHRRLKQLYLGPMEIDLKKDVADYAWALNDCSGMKPTDLARIFKKSWYNYESKPLFPADVAREFGMSEKDMLTKLADYAQKNPFIDNVVATTKNGKAVRREHFEEALPLYYAALGGPK
jgi:hypothetical protein